ncbi:hypothetical protein D3880_01065 [Pseudomonas cavernae]|uniref:Uncharacterized protein n=1 Tax=Pseudomonas cavernae TaxID=2320867 RepID=A0A385YX93_9PSED|nr:hypothetical protein D3880_01065 [Pseudomonas cavernae]
MSGRAAHGPVPKVGSGHSQRGGYASIRPPRKTHPWPMKRAQGDHESFESSADDPLRPDRRAEDPG